MRAGRDVLERTGGVAGREEGVQQHAVGLLAGELQRPGAGDAEVEGNVGAHGGGLEPCTLDPDGPAGERHFLPPEQRLDHVDGLAQPGEREIEGHALGREHQG